MIYVTISKVQGENRVRDEHGKLQATQAAKYCAIIHDGDRHRRFWGAAKPNMNAAKKSAEEVFGPLDWQGYPGYLGFEGVYAAAQIA